MKCIETGSSHDILLKFSNCLEWLTELRKIHDLHLQSKCIFCILPTDTNEQADEEVHRARSRKVLHFCPHEVGAYHPPSTWMCSPIQKLWISLLRVSIEFSLQCTCPFPWRLGVELKVPPSNHVVFLVSGLILRLSGDPTLSYLTSINSGVVKRIKDLLIIKEIPRVLGVLYQEEWTKCLYFIISKAVTDSDTSP